MVVQKQGSAASEGFMVSNPPRAAVLALTAKPRSGASGALVPCSCLYEHKKHLTGSHRGLCGWAGSHSDGRSWHLGRECGRGNLLKPLTL